MQQNLDIDSFWEYSDPALSEERFREALPATQGDQRLELLTQIARTYSLRGLFDQAHKILDEVDQQFETAGPRPKIRSLLERGRNHNSAGEVEIARTRFISAWELARDANQEGLAVDAAHMLAITFGGSQDAVEWGLAGLNLARQSSDDKARALIPAMLNNAAWDLHTQGKYSAALELFIEAQAEWQTKGKTAQIQIAKWSVARCLRSLGRFSEALDIQRSLEAEHKSAGTVDGYVFEEIAENLEELGQRADARVYFGQAAENLGQDEWFVENEPERLARLKQRAA